MEGADSDRSHDMRLVWRLARRCKEIIDRYEQLFTSELYVCMYVCMYVFMYVCMCMYLIWRHARRCKEIIDLYEQRFTSELYVCMCVCMYVCECVYSGTLLVQ